MIDTDTVADVRELSKLLFGNRLRLEVAAAIATEPTGVVYARALANRLKINDNQAAAELRTFETAGLLEHTPTERGGPAVFYRRVPSTYWDMASEVFQEAWTRSEQSASSPRRRTDGSRSGTEESPLLRLQSDERLVALTRRGNQAAFEALAARYHARLLAFCRHMLSSKEDAEDLLQEVFSAAFNAMLADERPINVRPWLYRIARNRSLNHLRRAQAIGADSVEINLSEGGTTPGDDADEREEFRLLVSDVKHLPETQRTALLLREIDALSYEQIAEAMEMTVPSVKSLLVRARVSLAEAADARLPPVPQ